jgi:rhamnosyltransferase
MKSQSIAAVIVLYHPVRDRLNTVISSIVNQVDKLIIVDNTEIPADFVVDIANNHVNVIYIPFRDNIGIGAAQNVGLRYASKLELSYALLSDQDTTYPAKYVHSMLCIFANNNLGKKIAAVCPNFLDENNGFKPQGFLVKDYWGMRRVFTSSGTISIDQCIASGMIINLQAIEVIGFMNEELFIDWVDLEWCWRARSYGFLLIGNAEVAIHHVLGDRRKNVFLKSVSLRSPLRHYYITRNCLFLALYSKNINIFDRTNLIFKFITYLFGFPFISDNKIKNISFVFCGAFDGARGILGKYKIKM